jgi:hypothetical protein
MGFDLPAPPPPEAVRYRIDPEALYAALDRERRRRRLSRRELLRQVGERGPSGMTRLGQGRLPSANGLARYLVWLGDTDLRPYLTTEEETP